MKKNLLSLTLCLLAFCLFGTLNAQPGGKFQLRNGDFEAPFVPAPSTPGDNGYGTEPPFWHSFNSCTGGYAGTARPNSAGSVQISRSTDTRHGVGVGYHSVRINARLVILVVANGNMTTGRVQAGSMIAASVENHNYTDPDNDDFNEPWTSYPDSIRFWAKYTVNTDNRWARMSAYIHDEYRFTDKPLPNNASPNSADYIVAHAEHEWQRGNQGWHQYTAPFDYASYAHLGKSPKYILITFSTNRDPGGGASSDALFIDDIEMVYSAWLNDLRVQGVTVDGFQKGLLKYGGPKLPTCPVGECPFPYQPSDFSWTPESNRITDVTVTNVPGDDGDADGGYTSILVTAQDYVTQVEYRMYYFTDRSDDNNLLEMSYKIGETGTSVPINVIPAQTNYNITIENPEEVLIPQIIESSIVLSDPIKAKVQRIEQPTGVNSKGMVVVEAENFKLKSYNVIFTKVQSANANLNWIKVANVDIANFHVDTLEYNHSIATCVTTMPAVTYEKFSAWANITYVPATLANRTATITVTAENGTIKVYKINFTLTNNNTVLNSYRINTTNGPNNAFTAANNYTAVNSASYTAPFTITFHSTAAQQLGCQGATALFPTPTVWFPDTNRIWVTAQDLVTKQEYKLVVKNTNCYLKVTSGNTAGLRYRYNGVTYNVPVVAGNNSNNSLVNYNITLPIGPNVPAELFDADPQAPVVDTIIYNQPATRDGIGSVTVFAAHDNGANKTYQVTFIPTLSPDATLKSLTYNGFNVPGFNPATENYTLIFPSTVTEVPIIEAIANFQWLPAANVVIYDAASLSDTTFIVVTAENGTIKTYRIDFEVVPREKDAYLVDIRYNDQSIQGFNPTVYEYLNVKVPYSNPTPPATVPLASSSTAIVLESVQLNVPPYTKYYFVYSEDLSVTKIYKVEFNRIKNTDATLADIKINGLSLPAFQPDEFEYFLELPYTVLDAPVVTADPAFQYANVVITQINTVTGTVTINVVAEDDAFTNEYIIHITRELSPVTKINAVTYEYDNETYLYEIVGNETNFTILLPVETLGEAYISDIVLADDRSVFEIDEQPDETNNFTGVVTVTAEDETEEIYAFTFERILSSSTLLTALSYSMGSTVYPLDFHPDTLTYYVILPFNNSITPQVSATASWVNTQLFPTQPSQPFGQGSILVISEDGQNFITYTIIFQRKGNPHLVDLSYNLDGTNYPIPNFSPTTFVYNVLLDIGTTAVSVLEYVVEDSRCTISEQQPDSPNGTFWVKLVTWNKDDSVTYTVNFTVTLSTEATLCSLFVNGVSIPNFHSNTFIYTVPEFPFGTELPEVTAEACHIDASVVVTDITEFPGTATVLVTAGDMTTNTYTIAFSRHAGDNTYLSEVLFNGFPYDLFNKDTYFYEIELLLPELPEIIAIPEDTTSIVTIEPAIPQMGDTIKIMVTALNGDVAIYQFYFFIDERSNNAYASMIYVDWKPIENFDKYTLIYDIPLPAGYPGKPHIHVDTEDPNASLLPYVDVMVPPHTKVIILAENGEDRVTYRLNWIFPNSIISYGNETTFRVYPNPVIDIIHFEMNDLVPTGYLEIYTMEGKKTDSHTLQEGINPVNVQHLQKGIYFYKIFNENTMLGAGKFIKN